eukprot:389241-Amphidinium_carterae.1
MNIGDDLHGSSLAGLQQVTVPACDYGSNHRCCGLRSPIRDHSIKQKPFGTQKSLLLVLALSSSFFYVLVRWCCNLAIVAAVEATKGPQAHALDIAGCTGLISLAYRITLQSENQTKSRAPNK